MDATHNRSQLRAAVAPGQADGPVVMLARRLGVAARRVVWLAGYPDRVLSAALAHMLEHNRHRRRVRRSRLDRSGSAALVSRPLRMAAGPDSWDLGEFMPARLAADEGLKALSRALGDPDPSVRTAALEVVCEFSADRAAPLLAGMIHDSDPSVRCAAAAAAARLEVVRAVSSLIVALDDPEASVRAAAAEAIETITGKPVPLASAADQAARRQQVELLKQWWKQERLAQLSAALPTSE
jgi:hypothetical protein